MAFLFRSRPKKFLMTLIILLSILWVISIFLINPAGEFPLNDDWSYAKSVMTFLQTGHLHLTGWTSMPLIGQAFWGMLFCIPFGFSFLALRISSLVLGWVGILAAYGLLKETGAGEGMAFLGALLLAFNPLYLQQSFTFMTDVPFTAVILLSLYFYARGFRKNRERDLILGAVLAGFACLIRQLGVVVPLAFGAVLLLKYGLKKKPLQKILLHLGISIGPLILFQIGLQLGPGFPARYSAASERLARSMANGLVHYIKLVLQRSSGELIYAGLFVVLFLAAAALLSKEVFRRRDLILFAFSLLLMAAAMTFVWNNRLMPLLRNVFFDIGLGPPHLRDVYVLGLPNWPHAPTGFWFLLTMLGAVCAAGVLYVLLTAGRKILEDLKNRKRLDENLVLTFVVFVLYSVVIVLIGYYDRYLIVFPAVLMAVTCRLIPPAAKGKRFPWGWMGLFVLLIYGSFSVAATHDYLSWNRARWKALNHLTEKMKIPPRLIDGGFEFNGWNLYNPDYVQKKDKSYWWIDDDKYVISFGQMVGYKEIQRVAFKRWIPPETAFIRVLERKNP